MSTTSTGVQTLTGEYAIDPTHSRIGFVARHAMVSKVRGSFDEFAGGGWFDAEDPARSRVEVTIEAASINTRNADRDAHLRSNDFFDMGNHPRITFTSTGVEPLGGDRYRLDGDLTIKGVTRPVAVDVEHTGAATDPFGNRRLGFEGRVEINRKDWGVNWNAPLETGGLLVGEKVTLELEVSAVKVEPSA